MSRPYVHVFDNKVNPLANMHKGAAEAYNEKRDYVVEWDHYYMVYYPIATKVVHGTFSGIQCYFHVHAHLWFKGACYEVGEFMYRP